MNRVLSVPKITQDPIIIIWAPLVGYLYPEDQSSTQIAAGFRVIRCDFNWIRGQSVNCKMKRNAKHGGL